MKFLCDVHISYKVVNFLAGLGYETIHVNQILDSFFLKNTPKKLIKINLGNISTTDLIKSLLDILMRLNGLIRIRPY